MLNWIVLNRTDYFHKMDFALNNLQRLICHKTQQTNESIWQKAPIDSHVAPQANCTLTSPALYLTSKRTVFENVLLLRRIKGNLFWDSFFRPKVLQPINLNYLGNCKNQEIRSIRIGLKLSCWKVFFFSSL